MDTPKDQTTKATVIGYFTALQTRDIEKVTAFFAATVDWYIPGPEHLAPWLGKRTTKEEIAAFFELLWSQTNAISGNIDQLVINGNVALTSGTFSTLMLKTNQVFDSIFFTEIVVENNLIVKYRLLEEGYGLMKALTAAN